VMQASLDSVVPNFYAPNGQVLSRNYLGDGAALYVLRVRPAYNPAAPVFGPMRPEQPSSAAQANSVSTQP